MIKRSDIYQSLAFLINTLAGLEYKVYNNHVMDASESYIWVRLHVVKHNEGFGMFSRRVRVDIMVDLTPDSRELVDVDKLDAIADRLDIAIGDYFEVCEWELDQSDINEDYDGCYSVRGTERYITVYDITTSIIENVLDYSFYLDFTDYCAELDSDNAVKDFMRNLDLDLQKHGKVVVNE